MSDDDLTIPDFLRLTEEQRKAAWERNPPKPSLVHWRSPEQEELHRLRQQRISDEKRMQRCLSKQRRSNREEKLNAHLESVKAIAEGKTWDVRTARWIDPIEAALKKEKTTMVQVASGVAAPKARTKKKAKDDAGEADLNIFGFRKETNYDRLMQCLLANINNLVPLRTLAENAYETSAHLDKHERRVVTMARKVQEKVITKRRMAYVIKKEKSENGICIGLFEK